MVATLKVNAEKVAEAVKRSYILATDIADYLVKKGEAFRTAHGIVGKLVSYAIDKGKTFDELSLEEYKKFSSRFDKDVYTITVESSVAARDVTGGTSPKQVAKALAAARRAVEKGE
jgi:argininosuccinate lyase